VVADQPDTKKRNGKRSLSKSDLIQILADKFAENLTRKDVKGILEAMASIV